MKEIWDSLAQKFRTHDVGKEKFLIVEFHDFQMIGTNPIMDQVYKFQNTVNQTAKEESKIDGSILMGSIIRKLPLSWKDHLKNLQHRKDEWTLEDLEKMERKVHAFIVRNWATSKSTVSNIKE